MTITTTTTAVTKSYLFFTAWWTSYIQQQLANRPNYRKPF